MTESCQPKPAVGSLRDLEYRLGVKRGELRELLKSRASLYSVFDIPKRRHPYPGKLRRQKLLEPVEFRRIHSPVKQLKNIQGRILRKILSRVALPDYMFGAVAGKTLVSHTQRHISNQSSTAICMDISDYYPSLRCQHVYFVWNVILACPPPVARLLTELTTFEWRLPQGAPTSPALANIYLAAIYAPICLASLEAGLAISTWVDDLIFSGANARSVMETVRSTLAASGFKLDRRKSRVMGPSKEKIITGTRAGRYSVRVPHRKMSELRAAIHRLAIGIVPTHEIAHYQQNLSARIAHIVSIHPGDGAKLTRRARKSGVQL